MDRNVPLLVFSSADLIERYLGKIATTSQEHIRQGFALAVASLPAEMSLTSGSIEKIFERLFNLITINNQTQHLIKQRRDTLVALCNLYESVHLHRLSPFTSADLINKYINAYLRCTRDYTNDRLGDSGRLVRETASTQLVRLLRLINENPRTKPFLTVTILHNCLNGILTNVCSKIDDLRVTSGKALLDFLNIPFDLSIDQYEELKAIFLRETEIDWRNAQNVFPLLVQLLNFDRYRFTIWMHCLMTAGELNPASQALYSFLIARKSDDKFLNLLFDDLEKIFREKPYLQIRIILPCVQACERLLSQSTFENYFEKHPDEFFQHWKTILLALEDILANKAQSLNNNPTLYLHFIKLDCSLLQFAHLELRNLVVQLLTKFFLHQYPWVRRQAAQNFYDTCILFMDEIFYRHQTDDIDHSEDVMQILTETDWEQSLEDLTKIRQTLLQGGKDGFWIL